MINLKMFKVFYWNQTFEKLEDRGWYRLGLFKHHYGKPVEKEIFEQAINAGKIFVTKIKSDFPLKEPSLLYHRSLAELQSEVNELNKQTKENALESL